MSEDAPSSDAGAVPPVALPAADTSFDLSVRLLTALVLVALAASVSLLMYRWLAPRFQSSGADNVRARTKEPAPAATARDAGPVHHDEVLMDPGHVFRCEDQGRVTYSDQACVGGAAGPPPASAPRAPGAPATERPAPGSR